MVFCLSNTSHNRLQPGLCQNGVERGHPEEEGLNLLLSQLVGSVIVFFLIKNMTMCGHTTDLMGMPVKPSLPCRKTCNVGKMPRSFVTTWFAFGYGSKQSWKSTFPVKLFNVIRNCLMMGAFVQRICVSKLWDSVSGFRIGWQTHHGPDWLPIFIGQRRKKVIGCQNPLAI